MSEFFCRFNVNDPHDKVSDIVDAATKNPTKNIVAAHDFSAKLRDYHWENRRITSHGTYFGDPDYQWLAHIPGSVVELLDLRHPGWDSSERSMREVLTLYPEIKCLPEEPSK